MAEQSVTDEVHGQFSVTNGRLRETDAQMVSWTQLVVM